MKSDEENRIKLANSTECHIRKDDSFKNSFSDQNSPQANHNVDFDLFIKR